MLLKQLEIARFPTDFVDDCSYVLCQVSPQLRQVLTDIPAFFEGFKRRARLIEVSSEFVDRNIDIRRPAAKPGDNQLVLSIAPSQKMSQKQKMASFKRFVIAVA
ncbi:MAG: hypothetical protein ACREVK_11685 [Gammaproteobacteria bacterium]